MNCFVITAETPTWPPAVHRLLVRHLKPGAGGRRPEQVVQSPSRRVHLRAPDLVFARPGHRAEPRIATEFRRFAVKPPFEGRFCNGLMIRLRWRPGMVRDLLEQRLPP